MADNTVKRKVLTVGREKAIRNLLALVKKLDSRRVVTGNGRIDLANINRKSFDTAILDLRCSCGAPAGRGYGFGEVWPSMVGKVLVINAEVNDPKTMEMVERYIYRQHSLGTVLIDLAGFVRTFIGRSPSPTQI